MGAGLALWVTAMLWPCHSRSHRYHSGGSSCAPCVPQHSVWSVLEFVGLAASHCDFNLDAVCRPSATQIHGIYLAFFFITPQPRRWVIATKDQSLCSMGRWNLFEPQVPNLVIQRCVALCGRAQSRSELEKCWLLSQPRGWGHIVLCVSVSHR